MNERKDPARLQANSGKGFVGFRVGPSVVLVPDERDALIRRSTKNAERIYPYIGGKEVNTSPTQDFDRYVIDFGTMSLEEAERWPDLLAIVREKAAQDPAGLPERWWQWRLRRSGLDRALAPLSRCLVNSQVTKHIVFAFQPTDRIFGHTLYVYPLDDNAHFAVLQSRVHEPWARLLSSSMGNDLRYATSDCFVTFPFPRDGTLGSSSAVERAGKALYEKRAKYMVATQQGLTKTYNQLKDPLCTDAAVEELRRLHEAMDRAVLDAYGWSDIEVPAYGTPQTAEERRALERFEDELIDRLFDLNAQRAVEERTAGRSCGHLSGPCHHGS